jgi:predicted transcriptional regulator
LRSKHLVASFVKSCVGFYFFGVNEMGKHRSKLKILEDILSVVSDNHGAKKTQIMYQAYLSYKLLVRYLDDVLEAGLVVCGEDNCYWLTSKGEKFLAKFSEYTKSREDANAQMNLIENQRSILEEMCFGTNAANGEKTTLGKNK